MGERVGVDLMEMPLSAHGNGLHRLPNEVGGLQNQTSEP